MANQISNNQELQQLVEEISLKSFGQPFQHKATFNKRLITTGGRYLPNTNNIEINPHIVKANPFSLTVGIIKHELCHYHLGVNGKNSGHTKEFKEMLARVGGKPSHMRGVNLGRKPRQSKDEKTPYKYFYQCQNQKCGKIFASKTLLIPKMYSCAECHSPIDFITKDQFMAIRAERKQNN